MPLVGDILDSLVHAPNKNELRIIHRIPGCHYLKQPLEQYGPGDFDKMDELERVGYESAKCWIQELRRSGKLDHLPTSS